jgi:hypothetical protein
MVAALDATAAQDAHRLFGSSYFDKQPVGCRWSLFCSFRFRGNLARPNELRACLLPLQSWRQYPFRGHGLAQIEDGEIVLDEERAQTYYLFKSSELLFDFANLGADPANRDPRNDLTFARR